MNPLKAMCTGLLSFLCSLFFFLSTASAAPLLLKEVGHGNGLNVSGLTLPLGGSAQTYWSGLQSIQFNNELNLLAFCIDPYQRSPQSNVAYSESGDFNTYFGADAGNVSKLYSLFYTRTLQNSAAGNLNAAAFQLALWELIADSTSNLAAGAVKTNGSTNASVKSAAQTMLDALAGPAGTDQFSYRIYTSSTHQDYLIVTAVPEPAVFALMALALGLMGFMLRLRK
jgi:hypothetical protein